MRLKLATLALICAISPGLVNAQTLHVISIADSNDATIGAGTAANSKAIQNYASLVSVITKLTLNFVDISGGKFSCAAINKSVQDLQAKPDDVIIFYYSGHGFAPSGEASKSTFPWFYCDPSGPHPNLEEISNALAAKGARFTITAADTCNVILPIVESPVQAKGVIEEQLRAMFLNYKGSILISSSKREEYSWYYPTGGLFTTRFIQILRSPPDVAAAKLWDAVISKATEKIVVKTPGTNVAEQPQAQIAGLVFLDAK